MEVMGFFGVLRSGVAVGEEEGLDAKAFVSKRMVGLASLEVVVGAGRRMGAAKAEVPKRRVRAVLDFILKALEGSSVA